MACVYLIFNKVNGKLYVGETVHPSRRWSEHKEIARDGPEKRKDSFSVIHAAIRKYGEDNFVFKIMEEVQTKDESLEREVAYIKELKALGYTLYNCNDGGIGALHTEETKKKISASNMGRIISEEHRAKISSSKKGTVISPEHAAKISTANTGKIVSEAGRQKMSERGRGRA